MGRSFAFTARIGVEVAITVHILLVILCVVFLLLPEEDSDHHEGAQEQTENRRCLDQDLSEEEIGDGKDDARRLD